MRFSARSLCTILLTTLSVPTLVYAQTTTPQTNKISRSSISGRVTIKEKGVGGVLVALRKSEIGMPPETPQKAITDPDGFYRLTNVAPGNYEVVPSVPAYVSADSKNMRSKQLIVGEDDNVEGINFALVRGGVITGRITDADGRPVIQQQVNIYYDNAFNQPQRQPQSSRPIYPAMTVQTDDRGIYRVFGLQAGRYKVASGRSDETLNPQPNFAGRFSYQQVFYPDVSEPDKAKVIEVSEGSEATDVDITLGRALQTFTATGRVIDGEKGLPMPNIRFGVLRIVNQRGEYVNSSTVSNVQGEFVMEGLLPGKYGINLYPNQNQSNEMRVEALNFEIIDQDLSGLVIKLVKGASLTGVVVIESEDKAAQAKLSELQITGFTQIPGGGAVGTSARSPIGPDGSFHLGGLGSGNITFSVGALNRGLPVKGFNITRLERDGVVVRGAIEIKDGENVAGVRVVLSYGSAVIRGVVVTDNGPLPEGTRVAISLGKPGERVSGPRSAVVDQRGRFLIEGIPAGTYEVSTLVGITMQQSVPRIFKQVVTVQEGSTQELTIKVELPAPAVKP